MFEDAHWICFEYVEVAERAFVFLQVFCLQTKVHDHVASF